MKCDPCRSFTFPAKAGISVRMPAIIPGEVPASGYVPGTICNLLFVLVTLWLAGCDSTEIDPFQNENRYYTVFGYLDQTRNFESGASHAIRVIPVTRRAATIDDPASDNASLDARVFTIDVESGQEIEWRYSLDKLDDGSYGHIFRSSIFVLPGRTYRMEVRRSDGIVTSAETRVPSLSSTIVQRLAPARDVETDRVIQDIVLPDLNAIWEMTVIYRLRQESCFNPTTTIHRVPYGRLGAPGEDGWQFTAQVARDKAAIDQAFGFTDRFLCAMGVEVKILDENWELPTSPEDLEELSFSNVPSNIENGYGFFGSIGLLQYDWQISDELAESLGQPTPVR